MLGRQGFMRSKLSRIAIVFFALSAAAVFASTGQSESLSQSQKFSPKADVPMTPIAASTLVPVSNAATIPSTPPPQTMPAKASLVFKNSSSAKKISLKKSQGEARPPQYPAPVAELSAALAPTGTASAYPVQVSIPALDFSATVKAVGTDPDGRMSVPTTPSTVGWYEAGTIPGNVGSAVFDAHVYLAFKALNKAKVGDTIYVKNEAGQTLQFIISDMEQYQYTEVPADRLFANTDGAHLNLITCSGTWLAGEKTYNHRLVVYADLAN